MNASITDYAYEFVRFLRTILIAACSPRHWDILPTHASKSMPNVSQQSCDHDR